MVESVGGLPLRSQAGVSHSREWGLYITGKRKSHSGRLFWRNYSLEIHSVTRVHIAYNKNHQ